MSMIISPRPIALDQPLAQSPWHQRVRRYFLGPQFRLGIIGIAIFILYWYLMVDVLKLWTFARLPGFVASVKEWTSHDPTYGTSLFTKNYYVHIFSSLQRVVIAFLFATALGVSIGLLMGWRRIFYGLTFPILELLR